MKKNFREAIRNLLINNDVDEKKIEEATYNDNSVTFKTVTGERFSLVIVPYQETVVNE